MMSYIALYREWRPTQFKDVVEQEHVVKALRYSVSTGRIAHAYLFCGTRGTGKTTMAHILSRAVNCLEPHDGEPCNKCEICLEILSGNCVDVLEIDAASNNSVDNVRSIRDEVIYAPTRTRKKVYIIDEVHMLSTGAFNALLKTLEEPPEHVIFILATTEPHKLPATILSRCQRFDFRRISQDSIAKHLSVIASADGTELDPDAAKLMARMSDGAMRDAISLLDQCISIGKKSISYDDVLSVVGVVNDEFMTNFIDSMLSRNVETVLQNVSRLIVEGRDAAHFASDLVVYFRNLLICRSTGGKCDDLIEVPTEVLNTMKQQAEKISMEEIMYHIRELSALENSLKYAANPRVLLEVTLIKLCRGIVSTSADLEERLAAIERKLESGEFMARQAAGQNPADTIPSDAGGTPTPAGKTVPYDSSEDKGSGKSSDGKSAASPAADNTAGHADGADGKPSPDDIGDDAGKRTAGRKDSQIRGSAQKGARKKITDYKEWPKVVEHLKSMRKMTIYAYLLNTRAVILDGETIGVVAKDEIKSTISTVEHIRLIEDAVMQATGRKMKIRCIDENILQRAASDEEPESDDILERARMLADKVGLPLEIIDE